MNNDRKTGDEKALIKASDVLSIVQTLVKEVNPSKSSTKIISLDSSFEKDLGLDSLTRVQLISRIESQFHLALPERIFAEAETTRDLFHAILKAESPISIQTVSDIHTEDLNVTLGLPVTATTLIEVLDFYVSQFADRVLIQIYQDEGEGERVSYVELKDSAKKIASGLQSRGLKPGEAVAIMLPTGLDYFYSFFGILLAGGTPVPIYPPARPNQLEDHMRRHSQILINCRASTLITIAEAKRVAQLLKSQVPNLKKIVTADELLISDGHYIKPSIKANDTAFIQYTSGSTGQPKGVVLSHANLLANIRAMGEVVKANHNDVFVSWLPLYHDMGLIGAWLGSMYYAALFVVMSPLSFLARPERWLWAIHRYKGTLSASPNFGYEYCIRRLNPEALSGLDLSSWRAAFNGAEAVSPETLTRFSQSFKKYGFKEVAMMPVYGLAESSVGLAFPPIDRGIHVDYIKRDTFMKSGIAKSTDKDDTLALKFPSSGRPLPGHQIRVVDYSGHEVPECQQGKVQFCGPSSTSGYFRNAEKTKELFDGNWLNTGDLGYMARGELFVTGRTKDIIIRAGRNIYPHELEEVIGNIEGIRAGRVAIFGSEDVDSKTERLIILAETRVQEEQGLETLRREINSLAIDLTGSPPDEIVFAPPNTVLKTSSGKIRRAASKDLYEAGGVGKSKSSIVGQFLRLLLSSIKPQLQRLKQLVNDWSFAIYCWMVYVCLAPVVWLTATFSWKFSVRWSVMCACARSLAKLTGTPISINGIQNTPEQSKSCVYVVNHSSYLDVYALVALLPGHFRFIAKSELKESFVTRKPLQNIHAEFVERYDVSKSIAEAKHLVDLLRSGESMVFFAEGTFSRIPGLMPFHLGAFSVAAEAGVPIIPIAIRGTRSMLRSDSWFPYRGSIHLEVGEPIDPKQLEQETDMDYWQQAIYLRDLSRQFILRHSGEPDLS